MKIAVLSGKGGTGKTFVSVNLSVAAKAASYIDCDVEEPNGRLFLKPQGVTNQEVFTRIPAFDAERCTGCRKCVDFCRFNALVFIKQKPMLFSEVCHSCGGCALVCPSGAIYEEKHTVGTVSVGQHEKVRVVTGEMKMGEVSAVPVIQAALDAGMQGENVIIDCPPGSGCSVMECVSESDYCVLVAEPTAFGFHNFKMVYELVHLLGKPCGIVINKEDIPYEPLEDFCKAEGIEILMRIPFREDLAQMGANGEIASERDAETRKAFRALLDTVKKGVEA